MKETDTNSLGLFVEHSSFSWKIWKGDELGHAMIITNSCGKSIGTRHPFRSGNVPEDIEDTLLEANAEQFGIDLGERVVEKLEKNRTRGFRHGGKVI